MSAFVITKTNYMKNVEGRGYMQLTREEQRELVIKNQKLVMYLVNKKYFYLDYYTMEDIKSVGIMGLIKASRNFDV